jgi:SAM-dependent methyltransferase
MDNKKAAQAASFGQAAEEYERGRPTYPIEAVEWLVPRTARHVLDLGAGTGKLTRLLVDLGLDVVAVDPSPEMLAQLEASVTDATWAVGTAESIPLPDGSVDAVLVAQAWHWVDTERAVPEVARVLHPGGVLGLIWNVRDERVPWVAAMSEILHDSKAEQFLKAPVMPGGPFAPAEVAEFEWAQPFDRRQFLDMVASRSYFITAPAAEQQQMLAGIGNLLDTHPDLAVAPEWRLPYRTMCFRMTLLDHPGA